MNRRLAIKLDDLTGFAMLTALDNTALRQARERAIRVRIERGESLFDQGDPACRIWLCLQGQLKLYRLAPGGQEKIMALINPGRSFAEATMFMPKPRYPVHCAALVSSELIGLDSEHLVECLKNDTAACFRVMATLSRRMQEKINQIDDLALKNAHLRIAAYLLDEFRDNEKACTFSLGASKKHIAGFLAVQPETLSRCLGQLQEQGIIACQARQISVLQPQRLEMLVRNGSLQKP